MPDNFQFVHSFPEAPGAARAFKHQGRRAKSKTISVRRVIDKEKSRCLMVTSKEFNGPVVLWEEDEYDAQKAGAGFTQAAIEARLDEVLAAE